MKNNHDDFCFADEIVKEMEELPKLEGTGNAKRSPEYIKGEDGKGGCGYRNHAQWNLGRILLYRNMDAMETMLLIQGLIVSPIEILV